MYKAARFLYQFYKWLIFIPILVISTIVCSLSAMALCVVVSPRFAAKWCGILWGRINCLATPVFVRVTGREHLDKKQSYVIVANHQSQFDILVIYGWIGLDLKWVMKKELRKVPFLGPCCEKLGFIIIDRSDTQAALAAINAAKEQITNGTSVIFFPEGTRSRDGRLGAFKKGAFRFALDLQLPILPVTIRGTRGILPPDSMTLMPGRSEIVLHRPIETVGYDIDGLPELMALTRNAIQSTQ